MRLCIFFLELAAETGMFADMEKATLKARAEPAGFAGCTRAAVFEHEEKAKAVLTCVLLTELWPRCAQLHR